MEQPICNRQVPGSSPGVSSSVRGGGVPGGSGGVAEWLMAADCKSAGLTPYVGSNPTPTTGGRGSCSAGREWDGAGVRVASGRGSRLPAGVAQLVERQPSKLRVAGSSPVARLLA